MKERSTAGIMFRFIEHLLFGGLAIIFMAGIVILPNLLGKIAIESTTYSTLWLSKSISLILIAGWMFMMAVLLLGNIAMKEIKDTRITQRILETSMTVLQMKLGKLENTEKQFLQHSGGSVERRKEDNTAVVVY